MLLWLVDIAKHYDEDFDKFISERCKEDYIHNTRIIVNNINSTINVRRIKATFAVASDNRKFWRKIQISKNIPKSIFYYL